MKSEHKSEITNDKIVLYGNYKKIISIVMGVILAMSLIAFLFSSSIKSTILNAQFYEDSIKKADTYNKLLNEGIPSLIMEATISDNAAVNILAKEGITYVIKNTIPVSWVEQKTNLLIEDVVKFISQSPKTPKLVLKLNDIDKYII